MRNSLSGAGEVCAKISSTPDQLSEAYRLADGLAGRVTAMVEKLCGSWPVSGEKPPSHTPEGVFGRLLGDAEHVTRRIEEAHQALNLLERHLD